MLPLLPPIYAATTSGGPRTLNVYRLTTLLSQSGCFGRVVICLSYRRVGEWRVWVGHPPPRSRLRWEVYQRKKRGRERGVRITWVDRGEMYGRVLSFSTFVFFGRMQNCFSRCYKIFILLLFQNSKRQKYLKINLRNSIIKQLVKLFIPSTLISICYQIFSNMEKKVCISKMMVLPCGYHTL